MTFHDLLSRLGEHGIQLRKKGGELTVLCGHEAMDAEFISQLRANKVALLEHIGADTDRWCPPVVITPDMLPLVNLSESEIESIVARIPGGSGNVQDIYPLAPLQEGILFHHLMGGKGDVYLLSSLISFDTRERLDAWVTALRAVVDRHDILRTMICWEGLAEPVQVVQRKATLAVEELNLDPAEGEADAQLYARFDPRQFRIDVRQAPMMGLKIARDESNNRWLLMLLLHHLAGDHTTLEIVEEEIHAFLNGHAEQLPEPQPFRNLVAHARLGISPAEHEAYFRTLLGDIDEPTAPFGLLEVQGDGSSIREACMALEPALARRLRDRARILGVSAASLWHLAWAQVAARVTGKENVVFGTVVFGRMNGGAGVERGMGLFINTLPMRIRVGAKTAEESVREIHTSLAELMRHEHAPLALAQRCSGVVAPTPLFSSLLNYRHGQVAESTREQAGIQVLRGVERTNYPITVIVDDLGEGFEITAQVQMPVEPSRVCDFIHAAIGSLVEALEMNPSSAIRSLDVLPSQERTQVIEGWNPEAPRSSDTRCIHEIFQAQVERTPGAVALIHESESLSYAELNSRANRLAHHLRERGVGPDTRVAICVERGIETILAVLAVLKAGGGYVPMDPGYPAERLRYMLKDSSPKVLLTQDPLADIFTGVADKLSLIDLIADAPSWADQPDGNPALDDVAANNLAYVIYTSGSTGLPKGVMVEHANVTRLFTATDGWFGFGPADVWTLFHSIAFDFSVWEIWGALLYGGRLVVVPQDTARSPRDFYKLVCQSGVTVLNQTPSAFRQFIQAQTAGAPDHRLRYVIFGGEALEPAILRPWYASNRGRQTRLINMYGITETTVHVTYRLMTEDDCGRTGSPIGSSIPDLRCYILDAFGRPSPVGVAGELCVGGAGVARGYLNRPELSQERFVPDPFAANPGARMYRSGDLGRWLPDGSIEYLGRNDFQVKVRGYRIELGEIEARLADHKGVREAVVIAREDSPGDRRLVAYFTCPDVHSPSAEVLRSHLSANLPDHMVPSAFVRLESLPLTSNGKLDRKALPSPAGSSCVARGYEPPIGDVESRLAEIWASVLKVERVGRNDNFFELGGHSLLLITLLDRMRASGFHTDVRKVFATPTLAQVAASVAGNSPGFRVPANRIREGCDTITPDLLPLVDLTQEEIDAIVEDVPGGAGNVQDIYPLAPLQEGMLFHHKVAQGGDPYLLYSLYGFENRHRLDKYLNAFQAVIDRNDILRTAIASEGLSEPVQVVWRSAPLPLEQVEFDPANGDVAEQLKTAFDPRHTRIDLGQAPMMRGYITFDASADRWLLLLLEHHIIDDNTTYKLVLDEIQMHLLGQEHDLREPLPFRNFVAQTRLGVDRKEQESFFRDLLGDVDEPTAPFGMLDVQGEGDGIAEASLTVPASLGNRLRERARALGVSPASVFHLAWALLLSKTSGREDVVFGTVLFGRMQSGDGADRGMGVFINTLPFRSRIGEDDVTGGIRRTHALLADLMRHEHASLALAQRCSSVQAPAPLFTALINCRQGGLADQTVPQGTGEAWDGIEFISSQERTNYPFILSVDDHGHYFDLSAQVRESIDPLRICNFMHTALEQLVGALEHAPHTPLRALDVLPNSERLLVLDGWNRTVSDFADDACVHTGFESVAARTPAAVAVSQEGVEVCFDELNVRANRLARHLQSLGLRPDDRVAVCMERSVAMLVAWLAILKAGGAYVPMDSAYPTERLKDMIEDSRPVALLTQTRLLSSIVDSGSLPTIDVTAAGGWAHLSGTNLDPAAIGVTSRHLAYVIYTSGSTGRPKGVMVEHRNLSNLVHWHQQAFDLKQGDRSSCVAGTGFDAAAWEVWPTLLVGGTLLLPSSRAANNPETLLEWWSQQALDVSFLPTPLAEFAFTRGITNANLRTLLIGGDRLRRPPPGGLGFDVVNNYGPTETSVVATSGRVDPSTRVPHIGKPISNARIYILDPQGQPAPMGVAGELYIGGDGVARGYLNRPDLTAERFFKDPFAGDPEGRMYKSGDLGRWLPDGTIEFLGRNDSQVKLRGFRIELGEIEARMSEHPGIRDSVVLAREDNPGDKRLVAYATLHDPSKFDQVPELEATQVSRWRELYDNTYAHTTAEDSIFDFYGWNSSYTAEPIPEVEMQEWQSGAVERILALKPRKVLEIGCGSGLLLLKIAADCDEYTGTDFSGETIQRLNKRVLRCGLEDVTLLHRTANDFSGFHDGQFDTIVINSVIQYFPNADYLLAIIRGSLRLLSPDGTLFIGDVRNLQLIEAFHASIQAYQADSSDPLALVNERTVKSIAMDKELLVDPSFFFGLYRHFESLGSVQVLPKLSRHQNELGKYRYDAILRRANSVGSSPSLRVDWAAEGLSESLLKHLLKKQSGDSIFLTNITNEQVIADVRMYERMKNGESSLETTIHDHRTLDASANPASGSDPYRITSIASQMGYLAELSWGRTNKQGGFHALLRKSGTGRKEVTFPKDFFEEDLAESDIRKLVNDPMRNFIHKQAAESLKAKLERVLPDHMIPAHFVFLDQLPLTPNGKLDRKALPAPEMARSGIEYSAPRTAVEVALAAIWSDLLNVSRISRDDNFFQLGGHSLLAVTLIERMRRVGIRANVQTLFATPTLAELAASAERDGRAVDVPPNRIPPRCSVITPDMLPLVDLSTEEIETIARSVPGGASNIQDIYPLAPLQAGILFHHMMASRGDVYLLANQLSFATRARLDDYVAASQAVMDRHDILRTAVLWEGLSEPVQVVWRTARFPVEEVRFDPAEGDIAEQMFERFNPRHTRIDIRQAPLSRGFAAFDSVNDRWLLLTLDHHLAGDHTSLEVMQGEIESHLLGQSDRLPTAAPFRNLVAESRMGVTQEEHERFFTDLLGDVDEATAPFAWVDVVADGSKTEQSKIELAPHLSKRLRERARNLGVSPASICHLAWALVLARISGRQDVVFGTVLFGRMQGGEGADRALGLFINTLPIRLRLNEESVESAVRRTHALLAGLMRHEHASLSLAQRCSAVPAPSPLFSTVLNFRHSKGADKKMSEEAAQAWQGIEWVNGQDCTNYPINLSVDDLGEGFWLTALAHQSIGAGRMCEFMRTALEKMVVALEVAASAPVGRIDAMPADERELLASWNQTQRSFPGGHCVHELVEARSVETPDATAVMQGVDRLTFGDLNAQANRLACHLIEMGVRPDHRVAICMERGIDLVVAMLAVLKSGGGYVPMDPAYPADRLAFMLEDAEPIALLTSGSPELLCDMAGKTPVVDIRNRNHEWACNPSSNLEIERLGLTQAHLAYVIYTSGSTGKPKGVMVEHRNLSNLIHWHNQTFSPDGKARSSSLAGISFDAAAWEIWPTLCNGGALTIPTASQASDPDSLFDWWRQQPLDVSFLPTPLAEYAFAQGVDHPGLKALLVGGDRLRQLPSQSTFAIVNNYGPTETTVVATSGVVEGNDAVIHIGRPIANTQIHILDMLGRPAPIGVTGEIFIGGAGVARGYLDRAELTAEKFLKDPFADRADARMYRTGDLGRWLADGTIEFIGRNDFQVKVRGFRVELGEIESRILEHPGIRETVVLAREDEPGDIRLVAYVTTVLETGDLDTGDLHGRLTRQLPVHMVPAAFVRLAAFPLTPNGKLDRRKLPAPELDAQPIRTFEAPDGEIEEALALVWSEVLKLARIGRHDNFFDMGGHSLLATRLVLKINKAMGIQLALRDVFDAPVLSTLAERILDAQLAQFDFEDLAGLAETMCES